MKLLHFNFYVIQSNGICLYHEQYGSLNEDPQAVSNVLTAVSLVSKEIVGESIKTIMTENHKFTFKRNGFLSFAFFTNSSESDLKIRHLLKEVEDSFHSCFPGLSNHLKCGNLNPFKKFSGPFANIIKRYS